MNVEDQEPAPLQPSSDGRAVADGWLGTAARRTLQELGLFLRTAIRFLRGPGGFARDWDGERLEALNPAGFAATALGVYSAIAALMAWLLPIAETGGGGLRDQITAAIGPYLHYGMLGLFAHVVLRLTGSRRRAQASLGIALYAGGAVAMPFSLLFGLVGALMARAQGTTHLVVASGAGTMTFLVLTGASYAVVCAYLARGLQALYRVRLWTVGAAMLPAIIATALVFGTVLPRGSYGWHPEIRLHFNGASPGQVEVNFSG